jgi:hypothetical protein
MNTGMPNTILKGNVMARLIERYRPASAFGRARRIAAGTAI